MDRKLGNKWYWGHIIFVCVGIAVSGCGMQSKDVSLKVYGQDFELASDVGTVGHAGSVKYLDYINAYQITGGGENIWRGDDGFFGYWRQGDGDISLKAKIEWVGRGKNAHRKAGWMIRTDLSADSAYVDAVVHGDGLTSMQYRKAKGEDSAEIKSPISAPNYLWLRRDGDVYSLSVSEDGKTYYPVGAISLPIGREVYFGAIVCAHDDTTEETALFSEVEVGITAAVADDERVVESTLEVLDIETGVRDIVYQSRSHFEAPNWSRDGKTLLFNMGGKLYEIPVAGGEPVLLNTGVATECNNDHGYSPDGKQLAVSHYHNYASRIFVLPAEGGEARLVTENGPSYWHGWSPDGKTLAYCAERDKEFDVYTIPVEGGQETRLTTAEGLDDGPDYSPDGAFIWFNSVRTGAMRIWRMRADGSEQTMMTKDEAYGDWFPHPSPDGKWVVFLSFDAEVEGHPANKNVALRMMPADGGDATILTQLFGGQGTINVPSWSPDSTKFAFVSYRLVK